MLSNRREQYKLLVSNVDLVVIVWCCFSGDTSEASVPSFCGADNPYRRTAPTSPIICVSSNRVVQAQSDITAAFSRVRRQKRSMYSSREISVKPDFVRAMLISRLLRYI